MIGCLHLADLHLGYNPDLPSDKTAIAKQKRTECLNQAVNLALDPAHHINLVIIAGDLFDNHKPDPTLLQSTLSQLKRLTGAGVNLITVPGNHDEYTYTDSVYRNCDWPGLLIKNPRPKLSATLTIASTPVYIYALTYIGGITDTSAVQFPPRSTTDGIHIGICHGSLNWNAGERSLPITSNAISTSGYDYFALGHIHQHQQHKISDTLAGYPGIIAGKGFSDPGCGKFTIARISPGSTTIEQVSADTIPWLSKRIDVSAVESVDELIAFCKQQIQQQAYNRLILTGTPSLLVDPDQVTARLQSECLYINIVDETTHLDPDLIDHLSSEPTVRGAFVANMKQLLDECTDDEQREVLKLALRKGLAALGGYDR